MSGRISFRFDRAADQRHAERVCKTTPASPRRDAPVDAGADHSDACDVVDLLAGEELRVCERQHRIGPRSPARRRGAKLRRSAGAIPSSAGCGLVVARAGEQDAMTLMAECAAPSRAPQQLLGRQRKQLERQVPGTSGMEASCCYVRCPTFGGAISEGARHGPSRKTPLPRL
jgi:hypothetical protein